MDIYTQLHAIGLNKSEITVYLFLLQNGLATPPQIARGTKIARTNCYNLLESLEEKDLIEEQEMGKRKAYLASDPGALLRSIEKKKEIMERTLPDLRALYTVQKNKPKIRFYEGAEGIQEIYLQTLSAKKVYGVGSTEYLNTLMSDFFDTYVKELLKRNIVFYDLLTPASRKITYPKMKEVLKGLYDARYFPEKVHDFPTDILIWDDNIALITLEEPIFGTVLTSSVLAKTFVVMFETMWGSARM